MCPRQRRFLPTNAPVHLVNRGVERRQIFREAADYNRFIGLLERAKRRWPIRIYAYVLMPNHFHLVVGAEVVHVIPAYMQWVCGRYACDLRELTETSGQGHVFQARYWSGPIDGAFQFVCVMRYVEANPLRARLVQRAEHWRWSSLHARLNGGDGWLDASPWALPTNWVELVNATLSIEELAQVEVRRRPGPRPRSV